MTEHATSRVSRLAICLLASVASLDQCAAAEEIVIDSVVLRPLVEAEVPARQTGVLATIAVEEGATVEAGALLASLDDRVAKLAVAKAELERAQVHAKATNELRIEYADKALEVARAEMKRSSESNDKFARSISQSQLDVERLTVEKLELERRQAEHDLEIDRFELQLKENAVEAAKPDILGYEVSPDQVAEGNAMNDRDLLVLHDMEDTLKVPATVEADVITSIFQLEHVEDPLGLMRAVASNTSARYMLLAVPVFSIGVIIQACFQNVMPRIIGMGHTHLFSERSINWMLEQLGFEVLSRWWFGSDAFDIHRSISVHLQQDAKLKNLAQEWDRKFLPVIDRFQLALDELRGSSEIHIVLKLR